MSEAPETPWIDAPRIAGELDMRFRQIHSHALSFEFFDDDGDVAIEAGVKWDGCINWNTPDDSAYHLCNPEDVLRLVRAFDRALKLTSEHLPTWDSGVAGWKVALPARA